MKTKLGVSLAFALAGTYLLPIVGNLTVVCLLGGLYLLWEKNKELTKAVIRVITILCIAELANWFLGILPDTINLFLDTINTLGGSVYVDLGKFFDILGLLGEYVNYLKDLIFIILAIVSFNRKDIKIPLIDNIFDKYTTF